MNIIKTTDNKDGSQSIDYTLTPSEITMFKAHAKKKGKKYSEKFVNSEILKAITEFVKSTEKA